MPKNELNKTTTKFSQHLPLDSQVVRQIFKNSEPVLLIEKREAPFLELLTFYLFDKDDSFSALLLEKLKPQVNKGTMKLLIGLRKTIHINALSSYVELDALMLRKTQNVNQALNQVALFNTFCFTKY